ncbi:type II secretion system protein E (GspE) [Humidesulfovibrio mexicanus]|uniref:Type II secretion system protein E (GspE) n=1 Tax=Humidesulfovibrio mexicanus TaxID=147047 RepID=A0A238ZWV4_9BACT|nr:GspE/PulE family protein [Humidesulfovibrio mexicanus]SNR87810.1 type II secretion system protein E (GspE) [Humidesulfovibrio mexicanus]
MKRERKRLGELLIETGALTEAQLQTALSGQKKSGLKLGQYLVQSGILKENVIIDSVSKQLRIERYTPDKHPYEDRIDTLLPEELAQKHRLAPLSRRGHLLLIAMTDPMDINALDAVEIATNLEAEPVICSENDFELLFSAIYGRGEAGKDLFGGIAEDDSDITTQVGGEEKEDIAIDALQDQASQAPVIRMVNSILGQAVREHASDVHISPEKDSIQLRFRVDGKLRMIPAPPKASFLPLVSRLKIMANMDISVSKIPQDGRFTFVTQRREFNVRASSLPTVHGENIVLRLLERNAHGLSLGELGLTAQDRAKVESAATKPYGLIVAAGPTGSGKSTTLYALLKHINTPDINIVTLEDPVEYRVPTVRQVQLNRKAGMTFASGLRSILRQDPDVILVGEVRDAETAEIAVQAGLTGHRVLTTLHTNDAATAITRLIEMGIQPYLVSTVLLASISQRLLRKNCPHCSEPYTPKKELLAAFGIREEMLSRFSFQRGAGCRTCHQTGFSGRMAIYEVLPVNELVQDMIMRGATAKDIAKACVQTRTMRTLKADALAKVARGLTTLEEAASAVMI